jgi:hypothetical protein
MHVAHHEFDSKSIREGIEAIRSGKAEVTRDRGILRRLMEQIYQEGKLVPEKDINPWDQYKLGRSRKDIQTIRDSLKRTSETLRKREKEKDKK